MPLYQNSVLKTYLAQQDKELVSKAYKKFAKYFHNPVRQQNIKKIKEEGFQQKFLMELFVTVFGYTINPDPKFNLTTEFKNEKGAKKADGAILKEDKALGVIELKSTKLKDLEKIRQQAFDYKANQTECIYVITSNFEKLRFYINNAVEFEEFDLFTLTEERFQLMYLCLAKSNILSNVPLNIKQASIQEEKKITDDFYKAYSIFKRELFRDLVKRNMKNEVFRAELNNEDTDRGTKNIKSTLFKKSQKLIDRFLFVFFAEDSTLLTSNSVKRILDKWKADNDFGDEKPLYDLFKQYFHFLDTGRKGTTSRAEIFAYNGGLFKPDPILDSLLIDNDLLYKHTDTLQTYNFESQVDVNILGHIFENSLNEIESVNAEIEGASFDKQKTKRKKDGVYYTPKYITKYIVDNTVGKLCNEKKIELNIITDEFRPNRQTETKRRLLSALEAYREWLLQLTILDPACGSGAFLNQTLDFLIKEHQYLDELQTILLGGGFVFPNIENTILENNIYGVDLNEESVEIAKLSLWLRTAQPRRKLNNLSENIKCGNSLVSVKNIAGSKAFDWNLGFPDIIQKGGFDVIIGNPPYGAKLDKETQNYLNKNYIKGGSETVISFIKLSHDLLIDGGKFGFIIPKAFSFSSNYKYIRELLLNEIDEIVDCKKVWKEVKLEQVIVGFTKNNTSKTYKTLLRKDQEIIEIGQILKQDYEKFGFYLNGISSVELNVANIILKNSRTLNKIAKNQRGGALQKLVNDSGNVKALGGVNIQREGIIGYKGLINKELIDLDSKNFINSNSLLAQNIVSHISNPVEHIKIIACIPLENDYAILDTINQITINNGTYSNKFICALLNSKVINWYCYRFIYGKAIRTMHFDNAITDRIPIPFITKKDLKFVEDKMDKLSDTNEEIIKNRSSFHDYVCAMYTNENSSNKMINWDKYDLKKINTEINLIRVNNNLSKMNSDEEYKLFEIHSKSKNLITKLINNKNEIVNSIDYKMFELFNLNEDSKNLIVCQMP
ncbi:N-6 DNA methylase [Leptobacterium flavescens]|uniref:site-specific DNA-methyltransferase (adenine-specific) n=1 Tax=Leptobacterium flavescens TaxID=472055 RepID=A0A6P0UNL8_9FLAO|nr:N-6 DNA methylase [Leptobacterium flavescens]NER13498.1 N-6 DNA methylase [Leptobacterium flavescens]